MKILSTTASAMGVGKQGEMFTQTGLVSTDKEAGVVVRGVGAGMPPEKKERKRSIMGLFAWKN